MKEKHKKLLSILFLGLRLTAILLVGIIIGINMGMTYQQKLIYEGMETVLGGSSLNITINLNETKMVEEMTKAAKELTIEEALK